MTVTPVRFNPAAPIAGATIAEAIGALRPTHIVTVPDTHLRTLMSALDQLSGLEFVRAATEDDVLAICAGLWMTGARPIALMQQVGLFASVNALRSFTHDHQVPIAILAGLYGRDTEVDAGASTQPSGVRLCTGLLDHLGVEWTLVERTEDLVEGIDLVSRALIGDVPAVTLFGAPTS